MPEATVQNDLEGASLKSAEIALWKPEIFEEYFIFTDFFYLEGRIKVSQETIRAAEQYADSSWFIDHMLQRINRPSDWVLWDDDPKKAYQEAFGRIMRNFSMVKKVIQQYPNLLNPLTVARQRQKPQWKWMDSIYDNEGRSKAPEPDSQEVSVIPSDSPISRLAEAMGKVADVYDMLAGSISRKDIMSLSPKDRINALAKLSYIHTSLAKFKPSKTLNLINVQNGNKDELEAALMDFNNDEE